MIDDDDDSSRHEIMVIDDLLQKSDDWRNVDDIVRLTFKAF